MAQSLATALQSTNYQMILLRFWPMELAELADGPTRCAEVGKGGCSFAWNISVTGDRDSFTWGGGGPHTKQIRPLSLHW